MITNDEADRLIAENPGVQGLAQLGRNAIARVAELERELAAMTAERDDYRANFSGLCHTLSVGSEGRPEMTAADWRKRVDEGIDHLLRPLIAERDTLRASLAEIDNAPTFATATFGSESVELIARPAKEGV